MQPRDQQILLHILDYCEDIEQHLNSFDHSYEAFLSTPIFQHSIAFCILQIGELVGKLSNELRIATAHEINWRAIKDLEELWSAIENDKRRTGRRLDRKVSGLAAH